MGEESNRGWILEERPTGKPTDETFSFVERPLPEPAAGEVLVKTCYLSVDPYMRGRIGGTSGYAAAWDVGDLLHGGVVGEVVGSRHPSFRRGEVVRGRLRWAEYATAAGEELEPLDPDLAPLSTRVGVVGMPGRTAYFGMREVAGPHAGETVVVSGAAGAVGSAAAQIARMTGCRVVGTAGTDEKCEWLESVADIDIAINYRREDDLEAAIGAACPDGVDVYFDNVGGPLTDAVFSHLAVDARVAICGQIALYNEPDQPVGPRKLHGLIATRAQIRGFLVGDFDHRADVAERRLADWIRSDALAYEETIDDGIESAADAFMGLFAGENLGKQLVHVADPECESLA